MGIADKLKGLTKKAEDAAATHKEQVHQAIVKAENVGDQRTGGQYHDQIANVGQRAEGFVDNLKEPQVSASERTGTGADEPPTTPAPSRPPYDAEP